MVRRATSDDYRRIIRGPKQREIRKAPKNPLHPDFGSPSVLTPQIIEQEEAYDAERKQLKPVEKLFDILSMGQYASANVFDELLSGGGEDGEVEILQAIKDGVTGQRKGDFIEILRKYGGEGWSNKIFKERHEKGQFLGNIDPASIVGFAANIFLDPLTYVGGGATKASKAAARQYADDAIGLYYRNPKNMQDLVDLAGGSIKKETIERLAKDNPNKLHKVLTRLSGPKKEGGIYDHARRMDKMWNRFYREGIRNQAGELKKKQLGRLADIQDPTQAHLVKQAAGDYLEQKKAALIPVLRKSVSSDPQFYAKMIDDLESPERYYSVINEATQALVDHKKYAELDPKLQEILQSYLGRGGSWDALWADDPLSEGNLLKTLADVATEVDKYDDAYKGAGEVSWTFMGKTINKKFRPTSWAAKSFDIATDGIRNSAPGQSLGDAVWTVLNRGPVGALRKLFGFRNPYQDAIQRKVLDAEGNYNVRIQSLAESARNAVGEVDDEIQHEYIRLKSALERQHRDLNSQAKHFVRNQMMEEREQLSKRFEMDLRYANFYKDIPAPLLNEYQARIQEFVKDRVQSFEYYAYNFVDDPEKFKQIVDLDTRVSKFLDHLAKEHNRFAEMGLVGKLDIEEEYLPFIWEQPEGIYKKQNIRKLAHEAGYTQKKSLGLDKAAEQQIDTLTWLYNIDADQAHKLVHDSNATTIETDLTRILIKRSMAHAKTYKRAKMMESFRLFGFNTSELAELAPEYAKALQDQSLLNRAGLDKLTDSAIADYAFDNDVAEIIDRAIKVYEKPTNIIAKTFLKYQQWWKASVTANPGFHMRNYMSNNVTGFMKHGSQWFKSRYDYDAFLITRLALSETSEDFNKLAGEKAFKEILMARGYGGKTIRELIDYMKRNNIVSPAVQGFERQHTLGKLLGEHTFKEANPFSPEFKLFDVSHKLGSHIESWARVKSFLIDIDDMARNTDGVVTNAMMEHAKLEAKKWFIDYEDLSHFEQTWLKKIIPFYSWLRKNISNQFSAMATPEMWGRLSAMPKTQNVFEQGELDMTLTPEYMREGGYFRVGADPESGEDVLFFPNIPIMDLNRLPIAFDPDHPFKPVRQGFSLLKEIADVSNPVFKTVGEQVFGVDIFRERNIRPVEKAERVMNIFMENPLMASLADFAIKALGDDRGLIGGVDEQDQLWMNGKFVRAMEQIYPTIRSVSRWMDGPEEIVERVFNQDSLEDAIDRGLGATDKYEGLQEAFRTLSFYAGIKFDTIDMEEQRYWRGSDIYNRALEGRQSELPLAPGSESRMIRNLQSNKNRFRRLGIY